MTTYQSIVEETKTFPPAFQEEVLDFVQFLKEKMFKMDDGVMRSYEALAESWLSPEDEEAWKDL